MREAKYIGANWPAIGEYMRDKKKCPLCGATFKDMRGQKRHLNNHKAEQVDDNVRRAC